MAALSNSDLGFFFEPRHHDLALNLAAQVETLEAAAGHKDAPAAVARAMGQMGLYRWLTPEGGQVDVRAVCLIREWLAYHCPLADAIFAVQGLGSFPIRLAGDAAQRAALEELQSGRRIAGFALTEPEAGSDVASMRTRAVPTAQPESFLLTGHKTLISNVGIAQQFVVFANARPEDGRKGITAFVVDATAPGLEQRPLRLSDDHPIGELVFSECEARVLGAVGDGFRIAMTTLDRFRVSVGAAAVGMARRALHEATAHVITRQQFGKALAEQQLVQGQLADMATELDAARLLVLRAALAADSGQERVSKEAAMAKLYATEAAQRIVDAAVQLLGGRGVLAGNPVEHLYRSVRPLRIYEGTSEIQRLIIARAIVKEH